MFRVYEARLASAAWGRSWPALFLCACLLWAPVQTVHALERGDVLLEANKAWRTKDRKALALARDAAMRQQHPLASWIAYWEISLRLGEASQADLEAFYARWPGTYVEDRLRNDWLLELGRRRDWKNVALDYPRFRMNDDREVTCYALLAEHLAGRDVAAAARSNWLAQRDMDDGCNLLANTLFEAKLLSPADVWLKLRLSMESNRPRAARQAAALLGKTTELAVVDISENLARFLAHKAGTSGRTHAELSTLALIRQAAAEPQTASELMVTRFEAGLPADLSAWACPAGSQGGDRQP